MYLKRRTNNKPIWIGLALVLFITFITYKQQNRLLQADFRQKLQTLDLGYSSTPTFQQILFDLPKIVSSKITGFPNRPVTDRIDIDIPLLEYKKILKDRDKSLASGILSNPSDVKAKIRYKGKLLKAKLRLKGDLSDHWLSQYRMSFRVSIKGGRSVLGFNKFSLQKPESRQHPYDQAFSDLVIKTGNLAPIHNYIRVFVNGHDWGVMNIEEHMSKELLEKQGRKESIITRFADERKGVIYNTIDEAEKYQPYRLSDPRLYLKIYDADEYLNLPINRKRTTYIMEERLKKNHSHLYDITSYGQALAISAIWNDAHPLYYTNSRHYFNPYTLKLEPIISDAIAPLPIKQFGFFPRKKLDPFINSYLYSQILNSDEYKNSLDSILNSAKNAILSAQKSMEKFQIHFPLDGFIDISSTLNSNAEIVTQYKKEFLFPENINFKLTSSKNNPLEKIENDHIQAFHRDNGVIEIFNLIYSPVQIKDLVIDNKQTIPLNMIVPGAVPNLYQPIQLTSVLKGDMSTQLSIRTSFQNKEKITKVEPTMGVLSYKIPKLPNYNSSHPRPSSSQAKHFTRHLHARHFTDGRINIFNLIDDEVTIKSILVDDRPILSKAKIIAGYTHGDYTPITIRTDLKNILDNRITIKSEYKGHTSILTVGPTLDSSDLHNPLKDSSSLDLPSFFHKSKPNIWTVPAGKWVITSPVIIDGNLRLDAGANLSFSPEAYLIIKGAVTAKGEPDKKIIMNATHDKWRGLYIINAKTPSILTHVEISDTRALEDGILALTGGTTFYKSEVIMTNVHFSNSIAEDALNIVESKFLLDNVKIKNCVSDAIDFDFSTGEIVSSSLEEVGGDALDFSGSNVIGSKIKIHNVKDKAVSAGEATKLYLQHIDIKDVGVGIASKDGSVVIGDNINIKNYILGGVMSYIKKEFYPNPSITLAKLNILENGNAYFRQQNTNMRINGVNPPSKIMDIDSLYNSEVMKK